MKYLLFILLSFSLHAQERDLGRECLALVGYSEARGESFAGEVEVERVVLNRLIDPRHLWGDSICEVVQHYGQFEGVDLMPMPRDHLEPQAWAIALDAADKAISTVDTSECAGAEYFSQFKPPHSLCHLGKHWFSK